jgi:uncharacterized protein (TIGR03437 family)
LFGELMRKLKRFTFATCVCLCAIGAGWSLISDRVTADEAAQACARRNFQAVLNFPAGLNDPFNLVVGDYNGDDLPDLAVFGANKSVILPGDGAGRFGTTGAITLPLNLTQAVRGDFNGDAIPDLAGMNFQGGADSVGLMLGDGSGNFRKSVSFNADQPRHSVAGDFNGDGKLDLAVISYSARSLTLYPGDGAGQFGQAIVTTVERNPSYAVEGDFNGDGKLDLAVANAASDSVTILANDGAGRFSALTPFSVEFGPYELAAGDFNRDGRPDLAVMKTRPQQVFIFLNNGAGQFTKLDSYDVTDGSRVSVADFNRDNIPDLALSKQGAAAILVNNGGGVFTRVPSQGLPGFPATIAAEDFNLDGRVDLVACDSVIGLGGRIYFYAGDGAGRFIATAGIFVNTQTNFTSGAGIGDFNRDGNPDLAVAHYNGFGVPNVAPGEVAILLGNGAGAFNQITSISVGRAPRRVVVNDFNGDGKDDLAVTIQGESKVVLLLGDGAGFFGISGSYNTGRDTLVMVTGDFNGDGKTDLVANGRLDNVVTMLLGDGTGFSSVKNYPAGESPLSLAAADFNQDGKLDLAVSNSGSTQVSILPGDGAGGFGAAISFTAGVKIGPLTAADYNNDGKTDLAVASEVPGHGRGMLTVFTGDGTGRFTAAGDYELDDNAIEMKTVDTNGDSRPDLVIANQFATGATVLLNNGAGGFTAKTSYLSFANPSSLAVGDLNKDGGPDLILTTVTSRISIALSACQATPELVSASAASFRTARLGAESIVAAFGANLSANTATANSLPLPTTLAGTSVSVKDSLGAERLAPLFFVAPSQINYQMPPGTAEGETQVTIKNADAVVASGQAQVARVAPGLFAANADGQGVAAATVLRVRQDGSQIYEPVARFDAALNRFVAVPIDLGPDLGNASDQVFLILFGTGLRYSNSPSAVTARIGNAVVEVLYAGAQGGFVGLDQLNLRLPRSLVGSGAVDIVLTVNGKTANSVRVNIQ